MPDINYQSMKALTQANFFQRPVAFSNPNDAPESLVFKSNNPYYVDLNPKRDMSSTYRKFMSAQNFHINPNTIHDQTNLLPGKINNRYQIESEEEFKQRMAQNNENNSSLSNLNPEAKQLEEINIERDKYNTPDKNDINSLYGNEDLSDEKYLDKTDLLMKKYRLFRRILYELKY